MKPIHRPGRACVLAALVLTLVATHASAQDPAAQVRRLEAAALDAYHNLELDRAEALLAQAQTEAETHSVAASERARLFLDQGVVAIGGRQDTQRGTQLFMRALELDRTIRIDPNLSTPETQAAFSVARSRAAGGARANVGPATAVPPATALLTTPPSTAATPAPTVTATIGGPASTTVSPSVVAATLVPTEPTTAAALGDVGDVCDAERPCGEHLACITGVCTTPELPYPAATHAPRFFFHVGYSGGAGLARQNQLADSSIPYDPRFKPADWNPAVNGAYAPPGYTEAQWLQAIEALYAGYAPSANGPGDLGTLPTDPGCHENADQYCVRLNKSGLLPTGGMRVEFGYFFTDRFGASVDLRVQTRAGLGTMSRVLFSLRGLVALTKPRIVGFHSHAFAGLSFGQIQLRPNQGKYDGPPITSFTQTMGEVVLVPTGAERKQPWIQTGLFGVQAGALFGYRVSDAFGLFAQPTLYFLFPMTSFVFDATGGVEITF